MLRSEPGKVLVFARTKRDVDGLVYRLGRANLGCVLGLHGDKTQRVSGEDFCGRKPLTFWNAGDIL